uniref:Xaa-Pro aminopeptidase P n=1 Tax=Timspurckia oligopyrenoides TaxID=708627 RepID=A0A7S0ZFC2_9RHOD|mmetsp:Transcript_2998/g.5294  ORF Transcript_2998/g.5294 Transcript_2998/m.5294 type:complete len:731 (+) Transcript_2998:53-2245(+)
MQRDIDVAVGSTEMVGFIGSFTQVVHSVHRASAAQRLSTSGSLRRSFLEKSRARVDVRHRSDMRMVAQDGQQNQNSETVESLSQSRLREVRKLMANAGFSAIIVPSSDPHNSEYPSSCFNRRAFISGFTGSAGTALITMDSACLWTDGRYFLQAENQLSESWRLMKAGLPDTPSLESFLQSNLAAGSTVAIDPLVHTIANVRVLRTCLMVADIKLASIAPNEHPVDVVWGSARPAVPCEPAHEHPLELSGKSVSQKLVELSNELVKSHCDHLVVSMLDELCWLLNIRGLDVPMSQFVIGYCIVHKSPEDSSEGPSATFYVDQSKISDDLRASLNAQGVRIADYEQILQDLKTNLKGTVAMDDNTISLGLMEAAESNTALSVKLVTSPVVLAKAIKNESELSGMRLAHVKDGAAVAEFLSYLESRITDEEQPISEFELGEVLEKYRAKQDGFVCPSFDTIAGSGPNGAVIHYRAEPESCRTVFDKELLLIDSGGQYREGTTDVTRTMHFGNPTDWQRKTFTLVLKGHIAVDSAVFPSGTPGVLLDTLARSPLWQAGLDYRHGTGHGVGAALNVHEGPHGISPRAGNTQGMIPGMIVSNEPGYYEDGSFGIRIENLLIVTEKSTEKVFGGRPYLGFSRLTMIPIQRKMLDMSLLDEFHIKWLNEYHSEVWNSVSPRLEGNALEWLRENTQPIELSSGKQKTTSASRRDVMKAVGFGVVSLFGQNLGDASAEV